MMTTRVQRRPTVIVTGANGRIGGLLVDDLRRRDFRIVSFARVDAAHPHEDDVVVDLEDSAAVRRLVADADADAVVHLASVLRGDGLEEANERIDCAMAAAVSDAGIEHVVYASTAAVYGTGAESARSEDSPLAGDSPYARSKIRGEQIFGELVRSNPEMSVLMLRIFNLAGPVFVESLVERLIHASAKAPVPLSAPDLFIRDYVHQDDLIDVLRAAIATVEHGNRVINVGAGVAVSTRMLLETLNIQPGVYTESDGPPNMSWADTTELVRVLGMLPRPVSTEWAG